ncbi:MAG TPA: carbohydrate porin [Tepidisphaeraceae bacterium]|nr:carbohydrate porin [Tepidisphaeraceae bacterium]
MSALLAIMIGAATPLAGAGPAAGPATQPAGEPIAPAQTTAEPAWYNVHAQATVITEKHDAFPAPYAGRNSLERIEPMRTSVTATLFLGARAPWTGGQLYFDPEVAGGEGFSGVLGIASFPNGEIPRVGTPEPEPYVARLYYQQDFGFGGETEKVEDGPNQLPGTRDVSRFTVRAGKFSAVDFFQQSAYSNDPRAQFMNWALFTDGAWDYPADTRGYTEGAVLEFNQPTWTLRYGAMAEPKVANGGTYDSRLLNALAQSLEYEQRWTADTHPGSAKLMGFFNRSDAGKYREAIDHPGPAGPDVTRTRDFRGKYGISLTADQEITQDLGIFARAGWNDGHSETWAFTEIDRSVSLGLNLKGTRWHRPDDVAGFAGIINGLSRDHRDYLGAGGYGFLIGDGKLPHYAPEEILEAYYLFKVADHVFVTPDLQFIDHPAYNSDRGPVFVGGVRVHLEF